MVSDVTIRIVVVWCSLTDAMRFLAELHFIGCLKTGFQSSLLSSPSVEELFLTIHFKFLCEENKSIKLQSWCGK